MLAHLVRLLIAVLAMAAAGFAFMTIDSWWSWLPAMIVLGLGWRLAEVAFRRLADAETRRADLEDRVRNPPP